MPWKNNNGDVSDSRPTRVRLPESDTRTAEAVTDEVLAEAGWYWEEPVVVVYEPEVTPDYTESSTGSEWYTESTASTDSFTVTDSITL
jgi:hypothetical protein